RLTNFQQRRGDVAGETNINIAPRDARPAVVIAVVMKRPFFLAKTDRQRTRIEGTDHQSRLGLLIAQARQIPLPEMSRLDRPGKQLQKDVPDPTSRSLPINWHVALAVMRDGDAWPTMKRRLAHSGDGPRVVNIRPKIAAVIDTAEGPGEILCVFRQPQAN